VINRFEGAIALVQADLSGLDPNDPNHPEQFTGVIERWNGEFASKFSTDVPDQIKEIQAVMFDVTNGVVTMTAPYVSTNEIRRVSPTGLIIRAGLGVVDSDVPANDVEPGFYPTPIISVFDDDAWKLHA